MKCVPGSTMDVLVGAALLAHVVWPVSFNGEWLDVAELADEEFWANGRSAGARQVLALQTALEILHNLPDARLLPRSADVRSTEPLATLRLTARHNLLNNFRARGALLVSIAGFLRGVMDVDDFGSVSWQMQQMIRNWWDTHNEAVAFASLDPEGMRCPLPTFPTLPDLDAVVRQFDCLLEIKLKKNCVIVPAPSRFPPGSAYGPPAVLGWRRRLTRLGRRRKSGYPDFDNPDYRDGDKSPRSPKDEGWTRQLLMKALPVWIRWQDSYFAKRETRTLMAELPLELPAAPDEAPSELEDGAPDVQRQPERWTRRLLMNTVPFWIRRQDSYFEERETRTLMAELPLELPAAPDEAPSALEDEAPEVQRQPERWTRRLLMNTVPFWIRRRDRQPQSRETDIAMVVLPRNIPRAPGSALETTRSALETPLLPPEAPPLLPPEAPPLEPPEAPPLLPPEAPPLEPPEAPPLLPPEAPPLEPFRPVSSEPNENSFAPHENRRDIFSLIIDRRVGECNKNPARLL
ncbi:hypothetical protein GNI_071600 [Gregarina niphandrodes]|uniref:Uncharacterized protein n=1 Tax=Gregarina niphandrodes TaxID=110365 RepID=A0A023B7A2_GRENI|nr:hypothetical protein GNI_071600 [Gregarina niphandrodes]EZG67106.1 hypothetical protein GNI_071600 [Gregarina niphandrodes]|eukprot:XP_011130329.1 hypothetical protein GNI_071600 [Gregarina niphandrodes]